MKFYVPVTFGRNIKLKISSCQWWESQIELQKTRENLASLPISHFPLHSSGFISLKSGRRSPAAIVPSPSSFSFNSECKHRFLRQLTSIFTRFTSIACAFPKDGWRWRWASTLHIDKRFARVGDWSPAPSNPSTQLSHHFKLFILHEWMWDKLIHGFPAKWRVVGGKEKKESSITTTMAMRFWWNVLHVFSMHILLPAIRFPFFAALWRCVLWAKGETILQNGTFAWKLMNNPVLNCYFLLALSAIWRFSICDSARNLVLFSNNGFVSPINLNFSSFFQLFQVHAGDEKLLKFFKLNFPFLIWLLYFLEPSGGGRLPNANANANAW